MSKPKKIETLEEALEALSKSDAEKAELVAELKEMRAELAKANKAITAKENIVEHKGKKYKVNCKSFHFNGAVHDASTLSENTEVLAELVDAGVGFLVEIQ